MTNSTSYDKRPKTTTRIEILQGRACQGIYIRDDLILCGKCHEGVEQNGRGPSVKKGPTRTRYTAGISNSELNWSLIIIFNGRA